MNQEAGSVIRGDCLQELGKIADDSVDLVYLDPPFFSNRQHSLTTRDRTKRFTFADMWESHSHYLEFMESRLREVRRVLRNSGSVFLHCDTSANFLLRALLDEVFGSEQFRSEIIWTYRRWSNSAKGLMPVHQTILFYSKADQFKFNRIYVPYSETTNVEQILQLRSRDEHGVSVYATDEDGNIRYASNKKGVPLGDVWEIPFLNPKAKERTGYPTQKPILLLERIIELTTDPGDLVVDPFCGSGTTLVAASLLGRRSIGFDISQEAVSLTISRLSVPHKTESALLKKGRNAYANADKEALSILSGLDLIPVQRNAGIDALIRHSEHEALVPVRVQRPNETLASAGELLVRAAKSRPAPFLVLVCTREDYAGTDMFGRPELPSSVIVVQATAVQARAAIEAALKERAGSAQTRMARASK